MKSVQFLLAAGLALACLWGDRAQAAPITYTISGPATGRVRSGDSPPVITNFSGAEVSISFTGLTEDFGSGLLGANSINVADGTISIAGVGVGQILSQGMMFVTGEGGGVLHGTGVGSFNQAPGAAAFSIVSPFFMTYDGISPVGSVTGSNLPYPYNFAQLQTTLGLVDISNSGSPTTLTFSAAVPEPASVAVLGTSLALAAGLRRRRRCG